MTDRGLGDDKVRILESTDLVRLIGEHVALRKKGREWVGLCPFHDDRTPSMFVSGQKQIYKCFSCGAGGDALSFLMNFHKMSFREALQLLADRSGIELRPQRPAFGGGGRGSGGGGGDGGEPGSDDRFDAPSGPGRADLLTALAFAQNFFRAILQHPEHGQAARELIARRGLSPEIVERFGLGAAPDRWDGLLLTIDAKRLEHAPFLAAGLLKNRESGSGRYDALRNRLTFPIRDAMGRVIAFGARRINDQDEPKYLNSPESLVFNKSATVYGLPEAREAARTTKALIVTEGYMDCIACHQAGVTNAVATLGTALNIQGARALRQNASTVVLLFDGDEAGQRAADRGIEVFFAEPVDVKIATLSSANAALPPGVPPAKDPDELLKQRGAGFEGALDGRARFDAMIASATPALDYRLNRLRARTEPLPLQQRASALEEELRRLVDLGLDRIEPMRREMLIARIAQLAGVPRQKIIEALPKARPWRGADAGVMPGAEPARNAEPARSSELLAVLGALLADGRLHRQIDEDEWRVVTAQTEGDAASAELLATLRSAGAGASTQRVLASLESDRAKRLAADCLARLAGPGGVRASSENQFAADQGSADGTSPRVGNRGGAAGGEASGGGFEVDAALAQATLRGAIARLMWDDVDRQRAGLPRGRGAPEGKVAGVPGVTEGRSGVSTTSTGGSTALDLAAQVRLLKAVQSKYGPDPRRLPGVARSG